jgi:hypothetical protein
MAKTVQDSKFTEWKGLDRISATVHGMKHVWREISKDDYGIDGEIEVVVPKEGGKGFETRGNVLKVQAKSGESYIRFDTEESFASPVEKSDLEIWNASRYPVLYIVYHPKDDRLYCKEVRSYVKETLSVFQRPCKIVFDKNEDEFNAAYFSKVKKYADVSEARVSFKQKEELYTNLFPVRTLPEVFHASTAYTDIKDIRDEASGHLPPICIIAGRLFTFANLRTTQSGLADFCDRDVESISAKEWIANDPERQRDLVFLLNQLLGKLRYERGLRFNRDYGRTYFPKPDDSAEKSLKLKWFNVRTHREVAVPRTVVQYYEYGLNRFWRHLACYLSFSRLGSAWFLRIIPKYFFTSDGETACEKDFVGPYTTRVKALEHNMQVLNHVLFWADFLANRQDYIACRIEGKMVLNIDRTPLSGVAGFAIPDDPAVYEEKAPTPTDMFSNTDLFGPAQDDDDDLSEGGEDD